MARGEHVSAAVHLLGRRRSVSVPPKARVASTDLAIDLVCRGPRVVPPRAMAQEPAGEPGRAEATVTREGSAFVVRVQ